MTCSAPTRSLASGSAPPFFLKHLSGQTTKPEHTAGPHACSHDLFHGANRQMRVVRRKGHRVGPKVFRQRPLEALPTKCGGPVHRAHGKNEGRGQVRKPCKKRPGLRQDIQVRGTGLPVGSQGDPHPGLHLRRNRKWLPSKPGMGSGAMDQGCFGPQLAGHLHGQVIGMHQPQWRPG